MVIHAVVDWFHRLVLQFLADLENNIYCFSTWLTSPAAVHLCITLKVSMHFCLNSVTFFWLDFARHFCSLIRPMTIVWLIQQLHWELTSSVSFWHLQLTSLRSNLKWNSHHVPLSVLIPSLFFTRFQFSSFVLIDCKSSRTIYTWHTFVTLIHASSPIVVSNSILHHVVAKSYLVAKLIMVISLKIGNIAGFMNCL